MLTLLKTLLLRWVALKALLKALGSLGWLLPIAFLLKFIGVPALILLAILAVPLLIVLAVVGLPLVAVVVLGGGLLGITFWLLSMGVLALKLALPVIAVIWVLRWMSRRGGPAAEPPGATT